ncbi:hypothetical protein PIB30_039372 [Stylosanthes scabra]|uniref:Uncharacterized protein n=1 Tax=Stylosanthes scabra TaxID=79078 RepID=A0ABU6XCB6_9FABA|nr:hypothetical protein [Stylosanthes scabra]
MSFVVFEREVQNFIKKSCNEMRCEIFERGLSVDIFPDEIFSFKEKTMLFKVNVKVVNINSYQPCTYHVYKLSQNEKLIKAFKEKFKGDSVTCLEDTFDLESLGDTSKTTKGSNRRGSCRRRGLERSVTSNLKGRRLVDEDGEKGELSQKMPLLDDGQFYSAPMTSSRFMPIKNNNANSSIYLDDTSVQPLEKRSTTYRAADRNLVCSSSSNHIDKTAQGLENENIYTHGSLESPAWKHLGATTRTPLSNLTNCLLHGSDGLRLSPNGNSTHDRLKVKSASQGSDITIRKTVIQEARIVKNIARGPEILYSDAAVNDHQDVSTTQPMRHGQGSSSQHPSVRPHDQQRSSLEGMQSTERLLSVVHDAVQPTAVNNMEALIDYDPLVDYEGVNTYDDSNLDQDIDDSAIPYHDERACVFGGVSAQTLDIGDADYECPYCKA